MRITDIVTDWLIETDVMEQAQARKKAIGSTVFLRGQIVQHLLKVLIMDESRDVPHWKAELNAWLTALDGIKLKGSKHLSRDVFFDLLYSAPFSEGPRDLDNQLRSLREYNITLTTAQKTELLTRIRLIMDVVCTDLSQGKFTTIDDYLNV